MNEFQITVCEKELSVIHLSYPCSLLCNTIPSVSYTYVEIAYTYLELLHFINMESNHAFTHTYEHFIKYCFNESFN